MARWILFEEYTQTKRRPPALHYDDVIDVGHTRPCMLNLDEHAKAFPIQINDTIVDPPAIGTAVQFSDGTIVRCRDIHDLHMQLGGEIPAA